MTEQMAPGFDFEAMRQAIEASDYHALVALYADDAELRTINKNSTQSSPQVLRGKEEISEMLRDVCRLRKGDDPSRRGRGHRRGAHSVQRGVRVSRRNQGSRCDYAGVAGRQDRSPDDRRSLGRVETPARNRDTRGGSSELLPASVAQRETMKRTTTPKIKSVELPGRVKLPTSSRETLRTFP
jgi:hypothetical protein